MAERKNILITGASSGLGRGMACEFARLGRNLVLCARRRDRLDQLQAQLRTQYPGISVLTRVLDVDDHQLVFETFRELHAEIGQLDRVIVNAGIGVGQPLGTGFFSNNKRCAITNFISALAQMEAAMELFRSQGNGHLVAISSVSAYRGMRGSINTYAATKAGLAHLAEGLRAELAGSEIRVTTIYPGYILTDMNAQVKDAPFRIDAETGSRKLVAAIEREPAEASVPRWPWGLIGFLMRNLPLGLVRRMV